MDVLKDKVFYFYFFLSYLIGSIPTSYIVGKLIRGIDIRKHGSGNVGATNTFRVLGAKWGIFVLIIDILKGFFPVYITKKYHPEFIVWIGLAVIVGHIFTIFLKFRGGKGVATSLGVFLVLAPKAIMGAVIIFLILFLTTRYVSLGSIGAAISFPILYWRFKGFSQGDPVFWLILVISILVVYRHRSNIKRLIKGTERRLKW